MIRRIVCRAFIVAGMLFTGVLLWAQTRSPLTVSTCEEWNQLLTRTEKLQNTPEVAAIIQVGAFVMSESMRLFAAFERHYPSSLEEVCSSPYVPQNCDDIPVIFEDATGQRQNYPFPFFFRELRPGDIGYMELYTQPGKTRGEDQLLMRTYIPECQGEGITVKPDAWILSSRLESCIKQPGVSQWVMYRRGTPAGLKRALAVQKFLDEFLNRHYTRIFGKPLSTLSPVEWKEMPALQKFRNDFTGGYAQWVNSPSSGNFQIFPDKCLVWSGGSETRVDCVKVVAYGSRGIPVEEELLQDWTEPFSTDKF